VFVPCLALSNQFFDTGAPAPHRDDPPDVRYPRTPLNDTADSHTLICAECSCISDQAARGWHAYLDMQDQLVLFCAECVERVFGRS
jgi:hypothetical protein